MNAYTLAVFTWLEKSLFWHELIELINHDVRIELICSLMHTIVAACFVGHTQSVYVLLLSEALKNVDYEQIFAELEKAALDEIAI